MVVANDFRCRIQPCRRPCKANRNERKHSQHGQHDFTTRRHLATVSAQEFLCEGYRQLPLASFRKRHDWLHNNQCFRLPIWCATAYTISATKTTLTVNGNVYCRHGYGSKAYDANDFVINASASQPFLKGKLIASIEAFDLLHKLSSTQYAINAQGRTVTWNRTLPNYVMLHIVYHFGKNPQRR